MGQTVPRPFLYINEYSKYNVTEYCRSQFTIDTMLSLSCKS